MSATLSLSLPTLPHRHPNPDLPKTGPATTTPSTSSSSNTDPTTAYLNARLAPLAARELEEETAGTVKVDAGRIAGAAFVDTGVFHRWVLGGCFGGGVGGVYVSVFKWGTARMHISKI